MVYIEGASSATGGATVQFRLNSDSGSNYGQYFYRITGDTTYNDDILTSFNAITQTELILAKMSGTAGSQVNGYVQVDGANSSTRKVITTVGGGNESGNSGQTLVSSGAYYDGASTISSFTLISNSGNFDAGTLFVYGA
jgi:filamentous hemagglutinin family protein